MTIVAPEEYAPHIPPPGIEVDLLPFWEERRLIVPRLQLIHTNGASVEGTVKSARNYSMHNAQPGYIHGNPKGPKYTTIPHIQFDRDSTACMFIPSNRQSITNARANSFSLGFETADTGYLDDPAISAFTDGQLETISVACAYYSILHNIPLEYPTAWDGRGTACHTEPFGYPFWTSFNGKICPGAKKKAQVRNLILPRAREIRLEWLTPPPPTPIPIKEDDKMIFVCYERLSDDANGKAVYGAPHLGDGVFCYPLTDKEFDAAADQMEREDTVRTFHHPQTGAVIKDRKAVPLIYSERMQGMMGAKVNRSKFT